MIREKLAQGLTARRIYQDLVVEHGFTHRDDSIKRYVRKLEKRTPEIVAHIHCQAGEEAQVDFGRAARTLKNGRYRKVWLFKMVLSHSRHSYESAAEDLLEIFHHRYQLGANIIATTRPIEDWGKILGDNATTSAILDRLMDNIHLIKITGRSYRVKSLHKKLGKTKAND